MTFIDMAGKTFGRLTVFERVENQGRDAMWRCLCECGLETIVRGSHLRGGRTASCGCLMRERISESNSTHGQSCAKLYSVLMGMRRRCSDPNQAAYKDYGGRGIFVCDEWKTDAKAFLDWAHTNGYREDLTIDRIDNDGNYSPENCRFVDRPTQCNNRRSNRWLEYRGTLYTLAQLARLSGLRAGTIYARLHRQGMTAEEAVETPLLRKSRAVA